MWVILLTSSVVSESICGRSSEDSGASASEAGAAAAPATTTAHHIAHHIWNKQKRLQID